MSMANNTNKVGFSLVAISTEQFATSPQFYAATRETQVSTRFYFKANTEDKRVGVFFPVEFLQNGVPFVSLEVACHFRLTPKSWKAYYDLDSGTVLLPKHQAQHLAMITVGTARGVLHARLDRTPFSHFILPALDITTMIKGDMRISV